MKTASQFSMFCHRFLALFGCFLLVLISTLSGPGVPARAAGGTLVAGVSEDVDILDPANTVSGTMMIVAGQVFDTLTVSQTGAPAPKPGLAQSWTVSPDGLTWTFTLRSGVTFHNGTALDANAVKFNFDRWWDPANSYHNGYFNYFATFFGFKNDSNGLLAGIDTSGMNQVILHLTRNDRMVAWYLTNPAFSIANPATIQDGTFATHPIGTGPFRFTEWVSGNHILLDANPAYWGGAPLLDQLEFSVIPDPAARFTTLQNNAIQVAYDLPGIDYAAANLDLNMTVYPRRSPNVGYLGINRAHGPLGNIKVRQAIAHAINKTDLLAKYYDPVDRVAGQFLPLEVWGYNPAITDYTYDPALARSLLAQAGYPNGFSTTLSFRNVVRLYLRQPRQTANAIKAYLDAVGIRTTVVEMESSAFLDAVDNGNTDLFLLGWGADYPHPSNFFFVPCDPTNGSFKPLDTQLCNQVTDANNANDPANAETLYKSASQILHNNIPLVPIANDSSTMIVRSKVAGLQPAAVSEDYETAFFASGPNALAQPGEAAAIQTHGDQAPVTNIAIPAGTVNQPTTFSYSIAQDAPPAPDSETPLTPVGSAFDLEAYRDGSVLASLHLNEPVTLTVSYNKYGFLHDPSTLKVYVENSDTNSWSEVTPCLDGQPPVVNTTARTISAQVCVTGRYAVFGVQNRRPVFLPMIRR